MGLWTKTLSLFSLAVLIAAANQRPELPGFTAGSAPERSLYFWQVTPVGNTAELVTLICRNSPSNAEANVPLVTVLRDTLAEHDPATDRLTAVWLLTYIPPSVTKRVLSAVPFFYWRAGNGSAKISNRATSPLLDLTALQRPVLNTVAHDILQWAMLDPSTTPIRASSRAYRTNKIDHERLHLEEAISYLRAAPSEPEGPGLTPTELHILIARLELRKTLLGGFVSARAAATLGEEAGSKYERIRSRNWELLRQCADKTGLRFEPLDIAGTSGQYAMLWYPLEETSQPESAQLGTIWKLLNIKNPWTDPRLKAPDLVSYEREVGENGNLLPLGASGGAHLKLVPLGVYSLSYPKMPLLMIDFRDKLRVRWHEMAQRSINEITAGVIGVSHFTNWYYYVGADLYDFIASRHGAAMSQSERLDSYSEFRVRLALDHQLDPALRREMQRHVESMAVNPLESAPEQEMRAAVERYERLQREAEDGRLANRLSKDRRAELAQDFEKPGAILRDDLLHFVSLGAYTHRAKPDVENLAKIETYRRAEYELNFLDRLSNQGSQPEVAYDTVRIQHSIAELKELMPEIDSRPMRLRATTALTRLQDLSQDGTLQADCSSAIASLNRGPLPKAGGVALSLPAPKKRR